MIVDHVAAAERLPCRSRAATMCTVVVRSVGVEQRAMEWTFNWTLLGAKAVADATIVEIRASFMM